jgi:hypothetical protein
MLTSLDEENKIAFITCIEIVLMRRGNPKYNSVLAKIHAQYNCEMNECVDHPEYLKTVLKEVYQYEYDAVLDEISMETERLVDMDKFKDDFFKFMMS